MSNLLSLAALRLFVLPICLVLSLPSLAVTNRTGGSIIMAGEWFDGTGMDNPATAEDERVKVFRTDVNSPLSNTPQTSNILVDRPDPFNQQNPESNTSHGFDVNMVQFSEANGRHLSTFASGGAYCCDLQTDSNFINLSSSSTAQFVDTVNISDKVLGVQAHLQFSGSLGHKVVETEVDFVSPNPPMRTTFKEATDPLPPAEFLNLLDPSSEITTSAGASAFFSDPNMLNADLPFDNFERILRWTESGNHSDEFNMELILNFTFAEVATRSLDFTVFLNSLVQMTTAPAEAIFLMEGESDFQNTLILSGVEVFDVNNEKLELEGNFVSQSGFNYSLGASEVPIPAAMWLFVSALTALFGSRFFKSV